MSVLRLFQRRNQQN